MSFLGMGTLEILVVLLVAFIFLGPKRMVDAARLMGKAVAEVRRMSAELSELSLEEDETKPAKGSTGPQSGGRSPADADENGQTSGPVQADESSDNDDGPVAFQPKRGEAATEEDQPSPSGERSQRERS